MACALASVALVVSAIFAEHWFCLLILAGLCLAGFSAFTAASDES